MYQKRQKSFLALFLLALLAAPGLAAAEKLKIGDRDAGGIVYRLSANGTPGMVVSEADVTHPASWNRATEACNALDLDGHSDWKLPSTADWDAIFANLVEAGLGGFDRSELYWTSSPGYGPGWYRAMDLEPVKRYEDRHPILSERSRYRVRAVRAFH